jgi:peptidoglycan LD-endopeptidase CwlK
MPMKAFLAWLTRAFAPKPAAPQPPAPVPASRLLPRDEERLRGVHPDLARVIRRARADASFIVVEGMRTRARQAELVKAGASRTMNSRHLTGHAVDIAPWVDSNANGVPNNGEVRWDWPLYHKLAPVVKAAAVAEGVPIDWGGDWPTFKDGPHFELDRRYYP